MYARKCKLITILSLLVLVSGSGFSAITSGQLTIINGLANDINPGATASSISIQVSDSFGVCANTRTIAFNGTSIIQWDAKKTHSLNQCTGISSVAVTPLKTTIGGISTIIYDSSASTTVPKTTATAAINYTAPTTAASNLVLLITGTGIPSSSQTNTGTSWGISAAAAPVFNNGNGALTTIGVPGGVGLAGFKAEQTARRYGVLPHQ